MLVTAFATALLMTSVAAVTGLGCPVEIEFALRLRKDAGSRHQLHVLQMRPQAGLSPKRARRAAPPAPPPSPLRSLSVGGPLVQ